MAAVVHELIERLLMAIIGRFYLLGNTTFWNAARKRPNDAQFHLVKLEDQIGVTCNSVNLGVTPI